MALAAENNRGSALENILSHLTSLVISLIASQVDRRIVNPVEKFILNSTENGSPLPANRHLERGTYRAAVLASHLCVKQVRPSTKLMHPPYSSSSRSVPKRYKPEDYLYYGARDQLLLRLKRLEKSLLPESEVGILAKVLGKRNKALAECSALLLDTGAPSVAPGLDAMGMRALTLQNAHEIEGALDSPHDFTALRSLWTPNLPAHLCKSLAAWGAWPKERQPEIAGVFEETFFGENELWLNSFAYFYIEEIRQDPELHVTATMLRAETAQHALERLEAGSEALRDDATQLGKDLDASFTAIQTRVAEVKDSIDGITGLLHRIQDHSSLGRRQIFFRPTGGDNHFKPFHFSEEEEEFVGRESMLEWLRTEVLETEDAFAWTAISGPAGMGKSRLAFHVMNEYLTHFRHAGFVTESALSEPLTALPSSDEIDGPTLLILDYAGSAPEDCAKFLARCALLASGAAYPVRALVLVRRADDEFFSQVDNGREYGQLREARVKSEDPASQNGEVVLTPLSEDDILSLMRSRMESSAALQAKEEGVARKAVRTLKDDALVTALQQYEADEGRPLYALLIADGLQRGMKVLRGEGETVEDARLRLLWDYLSGQYHRRWKPASMHNAAANDIAGEKLDRHVSFAILSTFCRGLTDNAWRKLFENDDLADDAQMLLPVHRRYRKGAGPRAMMDDQLLLPMIVGARRGAQETIFPAMEPDLIGEALLLGVFHDVGEKWCETHGVAEDRRDFLVDLAWRADPDGTAYFANLVAQDFPGTAEAAGWLLPKTSRKEYELPRARLLRNLTSLILSGFRDRAATIDDVRRLDRLIRMFDFSEDVAEEAIAQYAQALGAIAEEMAFVINKSIAPTKRLQAEPFDDPQKSEEVQSFEIAAEDRPADASEQIHAAEALDSIADPEEVLKRKSGSKTVALTMRVLRRIFRTIPNYVARDYSFDIRAALFETLGWALTSVYWEHRSDQSKYGFAPTKISEKEKTERAAFLSAIEALIPPQQPDEETVGLVASLMHAAIYAEAGSQLDRGDRCYSAIRNLTTVGTFSHAGALSRSMSFLSNYITNQSKRELLSHSFGEVHEEQIIDCVDKLFEQGISLSYFSNVDNLRMVSFYLNIAFFRIIRDPESLESEKISYMYVKNYLLFCRKHRFEPASNSVFQIMAYFSSSVMSSDGEGRWEFQQFLEFVDQAGFNKRSLNNPGWTNLYWCLIQFMRCSRSAWPISKALIERMVSDVGTRAEVSLQRILNNIEWLDSVTAEHCTDVVPLLETTPLEKAQTRLGLFGKALLDNNDDHLMDEISRWWATENSEEAIMQRTFALQIVMLLLPWRSMQDPFLVPYRAFVMGELKSVAVSDISDVTRHRYHSVLTDAACMFVQLEIADGATFDVWIDAVRAD